MSSRFQIAFCILGVICGSLFAQNYQCHWSVVDIGGGTMSSTSYRASAAVGQTAVGHMSSSSYQSFVGFWQIDTTPGGVQEESHWSVTEPLVTRLYAPYPNPCPSNVAPAIRYSLATDAHVSIRLYDLLGRNVRNLVNATQKPGRYSVRASDFGSRVSRLGPGVYFLKMSAGSYKATNKLILL